MKKICFTLSILCLVLSTYYSFAAASAHRPVPVLVLSGNAYERGIQHGTQMKGAIAAVYKKWKSSIQQDTGKDPDVVIADFLGSSYYKAAIQAHTPELWQEVQGIAAGSGQKIDDVLAFQLIDEYWGYLERLKQEAVAKEHCSAIGVAASKGYPTFIAQNIDIDTYMQGYQVLIHVAASEDTPEQFIMSCAGFIGFAGMNGEGVGVVINALTDLNSKPEGLPVSFVTRAILDKRTPEEALHFVRNVDHATGQNYLIGTSAEVINLEASSDNVVPFYPLDDKQVVFHTNHSLANHDVKPWKETYHAHILSGAAPYTNSQKRFMALQSRLSAPENPVTTSLVKATLRSKDDVQHPVCTAFSKEKSSFTFSSVLFTFGKKPSVQVTNGSPDQAEYEEYFFEQLL